MLSQIYDSADKNQLLLTMQACVCVSLTLPLPCLSVWQPAATKNYLHKTFAFLEQSDVPQQEASLDSDCFCSFGWH